MINKISIALFLFIFLAYGCNSQTENATKSKDNVKETIPHQYGGWYCPDNLTGFPPIDITDWKNVPVVNGRMPSKEETRNGTSLIFVDPEKHPDAKPLDMQMPQLAKFYNRNSGKEEHIILIQAVTISNDTIVGFRYLNGGNGSAHLKEVEILSDSEIKKLPTTRFVSFEIEIKATKKDVWKVLREPDYNPPLQAIYDAGNKLSKDWNKDSRINFAYPKGKMITSEYAGDLFGNKYIQIDSKWDEYMFVEKFLLSEDKEKKTSQLQIVCGPYDADFESQKYILKKWAEKVKELSETM